MNTDHPSLIVSKLQNLQAIKKHLNQYDVIFINISDEFARASHNVKSMIDYLTKTIVRKLKEAYPNSEISTPEFFRFSASGSL